MIIITQYVLKENPSGFFLVRSEEQHVCPICGGKLNRFGRRNRTKLEKNGVKIILSIQRLRCSHCKRIHHELPDCLVPYKHYGQESIEEVLSAEGNKEITVAADNSTILRWESWFASRINHFIGCLRAITFKIQKIVVDSGACLKSPLQGIYQFVGNAAKWLARVVRPVANSNNWK